MTNGTLTLTDFLLARIADDEAALTRMGMGDGWYKPERYEAECEAKRRILEVHRDLLDDPDPFCWNCDEERWPCTTLRALAMPYADHPDYREEWRP